MKRKTAFTIVELIIVIAVIGILAAILIPTFANVIDKSNEKSAMSNAKNTLTAYLAEVNDYHGGGVPEVEHIVMVVEQSDYYYLYGYNNDDAYPNAGKLMKATTRYAKSDYTDISEFLSEKNCTQANYDIDNTDGKAFVLTTAGSPDMRAAGGFMEVIDCYPTFGEHQNVTSLVGFLIGDVDTVAGGGDGEAEPPEAAHTTACINDGNIEFICQDGVNKYRIENGEYIPYEGSFLITGNGTQANKCVNILSGNHTIILSNVNTNAGSVPPIRLENGYSDNITIVLAAGTTNTLISTRNSAIQNSDATGILTITGTGTLIARGGDTQVNSAGIGACADHKAGKIVIESGTIEAYGGRNGAGIGGSSSKTTEGITINGGTITAEGGNGAAGIGGGQGGKGENITINGGTITAEGGNGAAGIGGGQGGKGENITINGGTITATGGSGTTVDIGNGINSGEGEYSVIVTGGSINATVQHTEDADGNIILKTTITVKNGATAVANTQINSITLASGTYNSDGVKTDDDGKLYVYVAYTVTSVTDSGGNAYNGSVNFGTVGELTR